MSRLTVSAAMVTWNSAGDILSALGSLRLQSEQVRELIVVDNASADRSLEYVRRHWPEATVIRNPENRGFAAAANQAIDAAGGDALLLINPDVELRPDFLAELKRALLYGEDVGVACGKLIRFETRNGRDIIDSAGITMTRSLRHLDRGSGEIDRGRYDRPAFVFGASGAAFLARRRALDQVRIDGRIFDERFHSYREDADLAWRLRLAGWSCLYAPGAVARHRRRVTPERRRMLPGWIRRNCVRNRFLLRANNLTPELWWRTLVPATWRDLLVFGACLTVERGSLPAFGELLRLAPDIYRHRRKVMELSRKPVDLAKWFRYGYVEELPAGEEP